MTVGAILGETLVASPLRMGFLKWQCRVRQNAMRDDEGRPDAGIMPALYLPEQTKPLGHIITILSKAPGYSHTAELIHMARSTNDPARRREQALLYFAASYYQRALEFSDILTATFPPDSPGAKKIHVAKYIRLVFDAFAQRFDLKCRVYRLAPHNSLYKATMAHNTLFNPALHPDTIVLGFEPDWAVSTSEPEIR